MAVRIRLTRTGRKNRSFWRIGVFASTTRRDGPAIELIGQYNPRNTDSLRKIEIKKERLDYWISKGAEPTMVLQKVLKSAGVL